jgi:hypothetical protein
MKCMFVFATAVVLAVLVPDVPAQSDPLIGTWKENTAKSKYSLGPALQSRMLTFEAQGNGVKASAEGTAADGSHFAYSYTANFDGNDNPVSGTGVPSGADTLALKRINRNTTEATLKKAGKVIRTGRLVVSKDGKMLTITAKGTNANGQPGSDAIVFDKQ